MCIVVVEDEPELRDLLEVVLQASGYDVLSFAEPDQVTRLQEKDQHPDLFLIDMMLPDMNGIELDRKSVV